MRLTLEAVGLWCRGGDSGRAGVLGGRARWAVADLDVTFSRGITALVGPNGSGKTTLIRHLATSRAPARGSVIFENRRVDALGARQPDLRWYRARLGYMPQCFGLYPNLTQLQFVRYIAELKCIPAGERDAVAAAALTACGLDPAHDAPLGRRSEGERRRAALAAAVVGNPRVLLLDEPMASCDPVERARIRSMLRAMEDDVTCVVSASCIADVDGLCSEIVVLDQGRVVFAGPPDSLIEMARGSVFSGELSESPGPASIRDCVVTSWVQRGVGAVSARVVAAGAASLPGARANGGGWREAEPGLEEAYLWLRTFDSSTSYKG